MIIIPNRGIRHPRMTGQNKGRHEAWYRAGTALIITLPEHKMSNRMLIMWQMI